MRPVRAAAPLLLALAAATCHAVLNYESPVGPRYAGLPASPSTNGPTREVRVVTYNVKLARHVDAAINVLTTRAPLQEADIVVLQEMNADATRRIAEALGMAWVYYPAAVHPQTHRDFGNAILSRWPIIADEKLMLPHIGGVRHAQRIAIAATVLVDSIQVRVYCAHLGTPTDIRPSKRREQVQAILANAAPYPLVIVAGDMNSHGIGKEFRAGGFLWPTEHNGFTTAVFNWDHIFFKGFAASEGKTAGIVRDTLGTSDHDPVWAVATLPH